MLNLEPNLILEGIFRKLTVLEKGFDYYMLGNLHRKRF